MGWFDTREGLWGDSPADLTDDFLVSMENTHPKMTILDLQKESELGLSSKSAYPENNEYVAKLKMLFEDVDDTLRENDLDGGLTFCTHNEDPRLTLEELFKSP